MKFYNKVLHGVWVIHLKTQICPIKNGNVFIEEQFLQYICLFFRIIFILQWAFEQLIKGTFSIEISFHFSPLKIFPHTFFQLQNLLHQLCNHTITSTELLALKQTYFYNKLCKACEVGIVFNDFSLNVGSCCQSSRADTS